MTAGASLARARTLTDEQRAFYRANGYVVLPQLAPEPFLAGTQQLLERLVDARIAEWCEAGLVRERYSDMDFRSRYYMAWLAAGKPLSTTATYEGLFVPAALSDYVPLEWLAGVAGEFLDTASVDAIKSTFCRGKFPHDENSCLPWHQDVQCLSAISGVDFVTAWIPLFDVAPDSSCLEVSPVGEAQGMFERVWPERSGYICMRESDAARLDETRAIDMQRGDVLFLSPYVPHRTMENTSSKIRWSVDIRYSPTA
jgi:ectoine hydroxylase-related dioxygenase (phytanoyl-CoA dioxygenase family)